MAKFNRSLTAIVPHGQGEQNFVDVQRDVTDEPLNKSLPNNGKNGINDGDKTVKIFPRKNNRFGNDMKTSIKDYDKVATDSHTNSIGNDENDTPLGESFEDKKKNAHKKKLKRSIYVNGKFAGVASHDQSNKEAKKHFSKSYGGKVDIVKEDDLTTVTKTVLTNLIEQADIKPTALDLFNEKWSTDYETPKSKKGMWDGWSLEELKKAAKTASGKRAKEINFAIRAKTGWGKVNEATSEELITNFLKKGGKEAYVFETEDYKVPKEQVHRIVDKFHVGAKDDEIKDEILRRVKKNKSFSWPEMLVARTVDYALKRHHGNQKMYKRVMGGDFHEEEIIQYYGEPIYEVMSDNATASDWIDDFVHSDNEKFKGKSKKERIRMALGAYYGHHKEEELNELDPGTAGALVIGMAGIGGAHVAKHVGSWLEKRKAAKKAKEKEKTVTEKFENNLPWVKTMEKIHGIHNKTNKNEVYDRKIEKIKKYILSNKKNKEELNELDPGTAGALVIGMAGIGGAHVAKHVGSWLEKRKAAKKAKESKSKETK